MPVLLHGGARFQQQPKRWQTVANAMANAVDYTCTTSG